MLSPATEKNYFTLFQIKSEFNIDLDQLGVRFRALQLEFHPDRFTDRPANERKLAASLSADINAAFSILSDPVTRAGYLLSSSGQDLSLYERAPMDAAFMMQQIELREQLAELNAGDNGARTALYEEAAALFAVEAQKFSEAIGEEDATGAGVCWVRMQYLSKFRSEVSLAAAGR